MSTYKFVSLEDANYGDVVLTLNYIIEPLPLEYLASFFGLFAPWPKVKEFEVKFIGDRKHWFEASTMAPCCEEICFMLDEFHKRALKSHIYNLVGKV